MKCSVNIMFLLVRMKCDKVEFVGVVQKTGGSIVEQRMRKKACGGIGEMMSFM